MANYYVSIEVDGEEHILDYNLTAEENTTKAHRANLYEIIELVAKNKGIQPERMRYKVTHYQNDYPQEKS